MSRRTPRTQLFDSIISFDNLWRAALRAAQGKRKQSEVARFLANLEPNIFKLQARLSTGQWRTNGYRLMEIREPKPRHISVAPFADRVIHQALCAVIAPIFESTYIADNYANRKGFGTHKAVARYEYYRTQHTWVLRADIYRYFPAIDHTILKRDIRRYIACPPTLALIDELIDSANPQEPVNLYFADDDLFSPHARRRGLPIGNLTSQWFGNLYLNPLDHYVKEVLRVPGYVRYVDDFVLFGDSQAQMAQWQTQIAQFLSGRRLILHPRKTEIMLAATATSFLGYELMPDGHRRLPKENVDRFRARLHALRQQYSAGVIDEATVRQQVSAWLGHAQHADTVMLRRTLFRGGWFDPLRESCASAVRGGSWNNNTDNARAANRNNNTPGNRNNNIGFRVASTPSARAERSTDLSGVPSAVQDAQEE